MRFRARLAKTRNQSQLAGGEQTWWSIDEFGSRSGEGEEGGLLSGICLSLIAPNHAATFSRSPSFKGYHARISQSNQRQLQRGVCLQIPELTSKNCSPAILKANPIALISTIL